MKYFWKDLPERKSYFTVRSARMVNLDNGKIVSNYPVNTKIAVVQKCVTPSRTYYRTAEAVQHKVNYAFEAAAFGLPNEKAPSVPSLSHSKPKLEKRAQKPAVKEKSIQKKPSPKDGEAPKKSWLKRLFGRKNG